MWFSSLVGRFPSYSKETVVGTRARSLRAPDSNQNRIIDGRKYMWVKAHNVEEHFLINSSVVIIKIIFKYEIMVPLQRGREDGPSC